MRSSVETPWTTGESAANEERFRMLATRRRGAQARHVRVLQRVSCQLDGSPLRKKCVQGGGLELKCAAFLLSSTSARPLPTMRVCAARPWRRSRRSGTAVNCVPWECSVACSTETALRWDAAFQTMVGPSGRAVMDVHVEAYKKTD